MSNAEPNALSYLDSDSIGQMRSLWASLDEPDRVDLVRAMCLSGLGARPIADAVGVTEDEIVVMRIRHDIEPGGGRREHMRLSPEKRKIIADMTLAGENDFTVAQRLGVSPTTIRRHRAAYHLPSPRRDIALHLDTMLEILQLHACGWKQEDVASRLGLHRATIVRLFRRLGRKWGRHNIRRPPDEALRDAIVALVNDGVIPSEIARRVGKPRSIISRMLRELTAAGRIDSVSRSVLTRTDVEPIARRVLACGGDLGDLAEAIGRDRNQAGRWARKLGLAFPDGRQIKKRTA